MSGWSGFTDEDLHRLKSSGDDKEKTNVVHKNAQLGNKKPRNREKLLNVSHQRKNAPSRKASNGVMTKRQDTNNAEVELPGPSSATHDAVKPGANANVEIVSAPVAAAAKPTMDPEIISDERAAMIEMSSLEQLQLRQKKIEDENRKKKQLIKSTIQQRYQKAQSETKVLQEVQKELAKIDQKLAGDVEMLRIRIEEASISFHHAEKRYERAESEFVAAKLELHDKRVTKDDLTHHLYTIIQENEERKAKKLEEIMMKLSLQKTEHGTCSTDKGNSAMVERNISPESKTEVPVDQSKPVESEIKVSPPTEQPQGEQMDRSSAKESSVVPQAADTT